MLRVLSLFSGIGAFDLGFERTGGFRTIAFCEIDPFCRRVLRKHWPGVRCYHDVRQLTADRLAADGIAVDVICGGWPCQPHSVAGRRNGSADDRNLWPEFIRLVREIRPRWVLGENVPGIRSIESGRFFGGVLRDLAAAGYDAEWRSISAADVGAPHLRERVWIVAYPGSAGRQQIARGASGDESADEGRPAPSDHQLTGNGEGNGASAVADAAGARCGNGRSGPGGALWNGTRRTEPERLGGEVADADSRGRQEQGDVASANGGTRPRQSVLGGTDDGRQVKRGLGGIAYGPASWLDGSWGADWEDETPRVVSGTQRDRRKRLIALGNSLIPQIPQLLGEAILCAEIPGEERLEA